MSTFKQEQTTTNPFPGLRPFRESEQHLFFGRESQIDAMVDKLATNRFLAVVGTSGSGKSSLVNCGLRPALRTGLMAGAGTAWRMAQCRPGGDPIAALSQAMASNGVLFTNYQNTGMSLPEIVDTTLRMGKLGLIDIIEQAHLPEGTNVLLVIDQFEELFRYRHLDEHGEAKSAELGQQAVAFVNLLLAAIEQSALPVYVVITMRSDFLGDCAQFTGLAEAINKGQYLVPRMTREQRRAAIAGPVGVGGAKIYPALLTRLVNDVGSNPDQLSILQHAMNRTWAYWENERGRQGMLDIECYDSIGSMTSALDQHAEHAFAELGSTEKEKICETIFKALTDKASDARGVRRPTRLDTLCEMCDASRADLVSVIDVFRKSSRSFLMPPEGVDLQSDTVIDISHESLMRVWKRLDQWADEEADAARMYQRLAEKSEFYKQGNAELLRDQDLRVALKWQEMNKPNTVWAQQYNPGFDGAMAFLKDSEKSENTRKRVRAGSIAAVLLALSGYAGYTITDLSGDVKDLSGTVTAVTDLLGSISDLSAEQEQARAELQRAEQEKILALNDVAQVEDEIAQAKNDVSDQVEASAQQAVVDIEDNLNRILTEEVGQLRQAVVQVEAETKTASVVAKEQLQFFKVISSLEATQQERIVEHFAQLEADMAELQSDYSETLAGHQNLIIQKRIKCEIYSLAGQSEKKTRPAHASHCDKNGLIDPLINTVDNSDDNPVVDCLPDNIPENILSSLDTQGRIVLENRNRQLACNVARMKQSIADLENESAILQQEIDRLRDAALEPEETIVSTAGNDEENLPIEPLIASAESTSSQTVETHTQMPVLADQQSSPDGQQTYLKFFEACENVQNREPSGCKKESEAFLHGKVFLFARVVTSREEENITLRWFRNDGENPIGEKQLTISPNPDGYRIFDWKHLDNGVYRACVINQSEQQACISIVVGIDNPIAGIETPIEAIEEPNKEENAADRLVQEEAGREKATLPRVTESVQNSVAEQDTAWETTRLVHTDASETDGFVVCERVEKLDPSGCSSELAPGRVYAFARIVTPQKQEKIRLRWFRDDQEIPELSKELQIRRNSSGFRTYTWNTFASGSYSVSLSAESGKELGKIPFDVK